MEKFKASRRTIIWLAAVLLFLLVEILFDVCEIVIGKYLLLTNPLRARTGRLWVEEGKDVLGEEELATLEPSEEDSLYTGPLADFADLALALSSQKKIKMSREAFIRFYQRTDPAFAKKIIDPLVLFDLDRDPNWRFVRFSLFDDQLGVFFLDGFGQPLTESYVDLESSGQKRPQEVISSELENDPRFYDRIVPAAMFFDAFHRLSRIYKLQIINDPYRLIQWRDSLMRVGISAYSRNGSVDMAFEVRVGDSAIIQEVTASEIAVEYLINEINKLGHKPQLLPPVPEEGADE